MNIGTEMNIGIEIDVWVGDEHVDRGKQDMKIEKNMGIEMNMG